MKMSKESKRGKEEKERKQMKMKNSALLAELLLTEILTTSCFHCLHVILVPTYWQFHVLLSSK